MNAFVAAPSDVRIAVHDAVNSLAGTKGFPGGNPVSIQRGDLPKLAARHGGYVVCPKTDGVRAVLVCTRTQDKLVVALMNRGLDVTIPKFMAVNRAAFQGTILDVEIATNLATNAIELLVFDAVAVCGVPVTRLPLERRIDAVRHALAAWGRDPADDANIVIKDFYGSIRELEADGEKWRPFESDGLVLTPTAEPNTFGKNDKLFKWKTKHTVDFLVGQDGRSLYVYVGGGGGGVDHVHQKVGELDVACSLPSAIVECELVGGATWKIVRVRTDKKHANDRTTWECTLRNATENISAEELVLHMRR